MLEIKNLSVSYGAIEAVKDISLTVNDGEIVSLIGANDHVAHHHGPDPGAIRLRDVQWR